MAERLTREVEKDQNLYRRFYKKKYKNNSLPDDVFLPRAKDGPWLSVDVARLSTPEKSVQDTTKFLLAQISTNDVGEVGNIVGCKELRTYYDPVDDNPAHAVIGLFPNDVVLSRKISTLLSMRARVVV